MTTFSLETCKRLSELLGEDVPKPSQWWNYGNVEIVIDNTKYKQIDFYISPTRGSSSFPAFTLSDIDGATWKKLGDVLGKPCPTCKRMLISDGDGNGGCCGWVHEEEYGHGYWHYMATKTYDAFLTGGMSEANKYLWNLIK